MAALKTALSNHSSLHPELPVIEGAMWDQVWMVLSAYLLIYHRVIRINLEVCPLDMTWMLSTHPVPLSYLGGVQFITLVLLGLTLVQVLACLCCQHQSTGGVRYHFWYQRSPGRRVWQRFDWGIDRLGSITNHILFSTLAIQVLSARMHRRWFEQSHAPLSQSIKRNRYGWPQSNLI